MSRVEQADRRARLGEGHRQVDADGALADAALARGDGHDVLDARNELFGLPRLRTADHRTPGDVDAGGADAGQGRPGIALDLVLERAGGGRQLDGHAQRGPVDDQVLDHVEADQVASELGFLDRAKHVDHGVLGEAGHRRLRPFRWWHGVWRSDDERVDILLLARPRCPERVRFRPTYEIRGGVVAN